MKRAIDKSIEIRVEHDAGGITVAESDDNLTTVFDGFF
jgi:hypothetical protein